MSRKSGNRFSEKDMRQQRDLVFFAEARIDQGGQGLDDLRRLFAGRLDGDGCARSGREHHQAHDRRAADGFTATHDPNVGVEFLHRLHEFGGRPRMQPFTIADVELAHDRAVAEGGPVRQAFVLLRGCGAHFPVSTRLAMVTYLRPASWAAATASASAHSPRTLASLTSIGRLMPARTSTFGRLMTEIARLDGVPPNMSVSMATPSPLSTRLTASIMSLRRSSTSSSGPMVTDSIWPCGPTTCSRAERNSTAKRPWVTSTRPIMELLVGASRLHRTKGRSS